MRIAHHPSWPGICISMKKKMRINERRTKKHSLGRKIVSNDMQKKNKKRENTRDICPIFISHNKLIRSTVSNHRYSHLERPRSATRVRVRLKANERKKERKMLSHCTKRIKSRRKNNSLRLYVLFALFSLLFFSSLVLASFSIALDASLVHWFV